MHNRFRTPSSQSLIQVAAKAATLDLDQRHSTLKLRIGIGIVIILETLTILAILFLAGLGT
jgi:hypothetical protein